MRNLVKTCAGLRIGLAYIPSPNQEFSDDARWLQRLLIDKPERVSALRELVALQRSIRLFQRVSKWGHK